MVDREKLKIAIVSPPYIPVGPNIKYGGTERVVLELAKELKSMGQGITLIAPENSETPAKLISTGRALWADNYTLTKEDEIRGTKRTLDIAYDNKDSFDIIHFHIDEGLTDPRFGAPTVTTLHDGNTVAGTVMENNYGRPIVVISNDQRRLVKDSQNVHVIYNGIDTNNFQVSYEPGDYLVFLGRVAPEKGMHIALDVAHKAKIRLVALYREPLVNESDETVNADWRYYNEQVKPRFESYGDLIEHHVDAPRPVIDYYLKGALATIGPSGFPYSTWSEPFGLFVLESMACGTPVIAYNKGGPAEIVIDGETGYLAKSTDQGRAIQEMIEAVEKIRRGGTKMRINARKRVEDKFSSKKMAEEYEKVYRRILGGSFVGAKR